jgi:adenylate kinase family enzyme
VGEGGAGKTTMAKKLLNPDYKREHVFLLERKIRPSKMEESP